MASVKIKLKVPATQQHRHKRPAPAHWRAISNVLYLFGLALYVSRPVWLIPLLCLQWNTPDDGQRNCPKHVEFYSKNKFEKLVQLVGLLLLLPLLPLLPLFLPLLLLLIKRYNLYKALACSTTFFQLSLFCATFFQFLMFMLSISSKTSSSQRVLGLPIGLLDMGFHLLIFCTILSPAMRSTWPNQFNLCFLINPIIFCPCNTSFISWLVLMVQ